MGYRIACRTNAVLIKRMEFLFSKHLVFTDSRIKSVKEMKEKYLDWTEWTVIAVCHWGDCKRVMNTAATPCTYWGNKTLTTISFAKFVKEILPTL